MARRLIIDALEVTSTDNYFGIEPKIAAFDVAKFVIVQAGYEHTVSYGGGTAGGPRAIRTASQQVELYDDQLDAEIVPKFGVCTLDELDCDCDGEEINKRIYQVSKQVVAADKIPVLIGGEHTVSYGNVKACWEKYKDLWILHFDAHSDLRDTYNGQKWNHATAAARFNEIAPVVQVGIRSREKFERGHPDRPVHCYPAWKYRNVTGDPEKSWLAEVVAHLKGKNVYITVDVDGFDPSVMPATGTPEPGGLDWWTVVDLIHMTCRASNVVGFDIVEVAPVEHSNQTEFAAARLLGKMIAYTGHYCLKGIPAASTKQPTAKPAKKRAVVR